MVSLFLYFLTIYIPGCVLQRIRRIVNGIRNIAFHATPSFLGLTGCLVGLAFFLKPFIVGPFADLFLNLSFGLLQFTFDLVFVWQ